MNETTINGFHRRHGQIALPRVDRPPVRKRDLRAAEGIIVSVLLGANFLVWSYVAARAFW